MSLKQEPLVKTSIYHLIRHSKPTEGRVVTPTQHNIDYETKVSHVEYNIQCIFTTTTTLNYTVTKAAQSLQ